MGVGKTATCKELQRLLPANVFLDGDWCWDMTPFVVNDETKAMVVDNICHLLNGFIQCSAYENIVFCWVMHEQSIIDTIQSRLNTDDVSVRMFSLLANESALTARMHIDVQNGIRTPHDIARSLEYSGNYAAIQSEKVDVSNITAHQAALHIQAKLAQS